MIFVPRVQQLTSNEVIGIVQAVPPLDVGGNRPAGTNHHQHGTRAATLLEDHGRKVSTRLDRLDVHEHLPLPQAVDQLVVQAAGVCGIVAAVADEDAPW